MTAALPVAATAVGEFRLIQRRALTRSRTNPRQTFDERALTELAKTIKEHGIVEPILARPMPGASKSETKGDGLLAGHPVFEIVAGERRWRAAELAGLQEVPVIIRDLTDKQALEIQTIENAQREDLHPLEQADGYERLIKEFGYTPETIADKIGKSRAHVFQIRKLRSLAPAMRKAFVDGEMDTTLATVVARVPSEAMQANAWQELKRQFHNGFSFRVAADFIRKNYMLDLGRAPFNIQDANLVPKAGTCGGCPKRTGNQSDLFPDVKNGNVCTDPACFTAKRDASRAKEIKTLEAKGTGVIIGAEAKRLMPYSDHLSHGSGYHKPSERCYDDPKNRTWGQLAKEAGADQLMIQNPHSGNLEPIVKDAEIKKGLEGKGVKLFRTHESSRSENAYRAKQKATEEKNRLETEARRLTWSAIRAKTAKLELKDLQAIAIAFWVEIWHENHKRILDAWGWPKESNAKVAERIRKLTLPALARFLVDLTVAREIVVRAYGNEPPRLLMDLGRRRGVQLERIRAGVLKAAKLKKAAKAAAAKAKARKAPGKVKTVKGGRK